MPAKAGTHARLMRLHEPALKALAWITASAEMTLSRHRRHRSLEHDRWRRRAVADVEAIALRGVLDRIDWPARRAAISDRAPLPRRQSSWCQVVSA